MEPLDKRVAVADERSPAAPAVLWAERLAGLQVAGAEIGALRAPPAIHEAAIRHAVALAGASWGVLGRWHRPSRRLHAVSYVGGRSTFDTGGPVVLLGAGLAGRAAQARAPLVLADYPQGELAPDPPGHALLAVPLVWQDALLGVIEVGDDRADRVFSAEDMALLVLLAQQTAAVLANAGLHTRARRARRQLAAMQQIAPAIVARLDSDQVLQTALRSACDLLGTSTGAVFVPDPEHGLATVRAAVGLNDAATPGGRLAPVATAVTRVMRNAQPVLITDLRNEPPPAPDGPDLHPADFRAVLAVPLIHQGHVLGTLCVCSTTPRRWTRAETRLLRVLASQAAGAMQHSLLFERVRAENAALTTTIRSMNDGVVVTDAAGDIILANPIADRLFDAPFSSSPGQNLFAVLASSPYAVSYLHGPPDADLLDTVLGRGLPYHGALAVRRPAVVTLEFSFLPVLAAGYLITGGVAVFHDISEMHRLNEAKTHFISMVSHELRTPLTSIKGFVKLVLVGELGPLTPQQRESLGVADREADRLSQLIVDLLDISRIDAGQIIFTWEAVPPAEAVAQVLQALQPQAAARRVDLVAGVPDSLPPAHGDRERIIQILTNLVGNAISFTPAGGRVTVSARAESGLLAVQVADTGEGIPAHALGRIFDRFYQVDRGSARSRGGTGLGLAIAKELIELHGGRVEVASVQGAGTVVTFTLPLAAPPPAPGPPAP